MRRLVGHLRPGHARARTCPAFVVMYDTLGRGLPKGHAQNWGAGFLPGVYQGTRAQAARGADRQPRTGRADMTDAPAAAPARPAATGSTAGTATAPRRGRAGRPHRELRAGLPHADGRARGARRRPRAARRSKQLYGLDNPKCAHFAKQCLIARRLVERGVRFVQIYSRRHGERAELGRPRRHRQEPRAASPARPTADRRPARPTSKQRGLLDSTLVIWGGEFGRLPIVQKGGTGRDHNPHAFTTWLAGGGVKGGVHYGADRRDRPQGRRRPRQRQRPARHDPAPAGHRPHAADLPLQRPRLPPDRRRRQRRPAGGGLIVRYTRA